MTTSRTLHPRTRLVRRLEREMFADSDRVVGVENLAEDFKLDACRAWRDYGCVLPIEQFPVDRARQESCTQEMA